MATSAFDSDPLYLLRRSLASNQLPVPTTTEEPDSVTDDLSTATHLHFTVPTSLSLPLTTPTRFISSAIPVDLRSIFLAFQKKDVPIPEYLASAQQLNEALEKVEAGAKVQNLKFVERLDLITWLEGASEESEYIKPLEGVEDGDAAALGAEQAPQVTAPAVAPTAGGRPTKAIDARLQEIYNGERRMGDRNSILRGIKPTDFSHVRKNAETFLHKSRAANRPGQKSVPSKPGSTATSNSGPLASHLKPKASIPAAPSTPSSSSGRRPDPIILLSPSASSLLRLSNIKSFLNNGIYIPPHHRLSGTGTDLSMLQVMRLLPSVDPSRPFRFILVDTTDNFKPDYWNRVVAVFTTGQTWQFKQYKWQDPGELFRHVLGVYVGWRGESVPQSVKGWGRGVVVKEVDEWVEARDARDDGKGRWRDREVVEGVWAAIEETMRRRGWGRDGPRV